MEESLAQLMEQNIKKVWSEIDSSLRIKAIEDIYCNYATLYHVDHSTKGQKAINDNVGTLLSNIPKDFGFFVLKPVVINNNLGRLIWAMGANEDSPVRTGMDIAIFENGKIKSLYVFLDQ